jgi:hypothetical protein
MPRGSTDCALGWFLDPHLLGLVPERDQEGQDLQLATADTGLFDLASTSMDSSPVPTTSSITIRCYTLTGSTPPPPSSTATSRSSPGFPESYCALAGSSSRAASPRGAFPRIRSDAFSAIITVAACVFARVIVGITEASTTRSPSVP